MSGVACNGNETTLFQCTHSIETLTECPDNSIAGVVCQGILYLDVIAVVTNLHDPSC